MLLSVLYFFTVTDSGQKNTTREWEGIGVILLGLGRDRIFFFLWEWDGRGLKIHSRVTL